MVVVLAGEWCGYRCRQQQDMEMICAFDWSSTDIHLAVGMEVVRRHDAHVSTVAQQLHKLGRRPQKKPTGEHHMLQPVDKGINNSWHTASSCTSRPPRPAQRAQRLLEEIGSHM